jgi:V8-like Glu-specific endopeptidase
MKLYLALFFLALNGTSATLRGKKGDDLSSEAHAMDRGASDNAKMVLHALEAPSHVPDDESFAKNLAPVLNEDDIFDAILSSPDEDIDNDDEEGPFVSLAADDGFQKEEKNGRDSQQVSSREICGADDRLPVGTRPWKAITQLEITWPNGLTGVCSGVLFGPRVVMTASHCLYAHSFGGWARSIRVSPGRDGSTRPYGSQYATGAVSHNEWIQNGNWDYDYGAIILPDRTLSNRVGYFGYAHFNPTNLMSLTTIYRSGYPGDKGGTTQWFTSGRISSVSSRRFFTYMDNKAGSSGGPFFVYNNGVFYVLGINHTEMEGGCNVGPNGAVRVNHDVLLFMNRMRNDYP